MADPSGSGLSAAQLSNARTIIAVGKGVGATPRDITIALMTALDESGLNNDSGGDRDSAGLFQQRPSQNWGTYAQVTNPTYAAGKFYSRLLPVTKAHPDMEPWAAAQTVQVSATADGSNYKAQWNRAISIYNSIEGGTVALTPTDTASGASAPASANAGLFASLGAIAGFLAEGSDWKRIGKFALGGAFLGFALVYLATHSGTVQTATSAVAGAPVQAGRAVGAVRRAPSTGKRILKDAAEAAALAPK